ncbi:MAG: hypothetical protein ACHQC8_04240 [Solirubrobacterales bacterium]
MILTASARRDGATLRHTVEQLDHGPARSARAGGDLKATDNQMGAIA